MMDATTPARSPSPRASMLVAVRASDHTTVCRLVVKHHGDLARWRNKLCCRLHALVAELVPGGISEEVVVNQARSLLEGTFSVRNVQIARGLEVPVEDGVNVADRGTGCGNSVEVEFGAGEENAAENESRSLQAVELEVEDVGGGKAHAGSPSELG